MAGLVLMHPKDLEALARATSTLGNDYDYGLMKRVDGRGHGGDAGKLLNHPTFSNESVYSTPAYEGGSWGRNLEGVQTFTPSVDMMNSGATRGLAGYFREREPSAILVTPPPYNKIR